MHSNLGNSKERGAVTVFVTIVMLLLITVLVLGAFAISTSNMRAVGNVQVREEAIAAANLVIERRLSSDFTAAPTAISRNYDLGRAIIDPILYRFRAKSTENHRVDRSYSSEGQHSHNCLPNHRHINGNSIALLHAERFKCIGELTDLYM